MPSITYITKNENFWNEPEQTVELRANIGYGTVSSTSNQEAYAHYNKTLDKFNIESGLLPPGLKLSVPGLVIFERPPTTKLVQYIDLNVESMNDYENEGEEYDSSNYLIPIPWQLYIVHYSTNPGSMYRTLQVNMFFMNSPLMSSNTSLYIPYINNFFTNGVLCSPMFDSSWEIERYSQDLTGVISSAYDWVWNTGFNADLHECVDQTVNQKHKDNEIVKSFREKYSSGEYHHHSFHQAFYSHMSKYSIEDVVNLSWANPSYTSYHDNDYRYMLQNQITDFEPEQSDELSVMDQFKEYIGPSFDIVKSYSDIIKSMFFLDPKYTSRNYNSVVNPLSNTFNDMDNLSYAVHSSIVANPS